MKKIILILSLVIMLVGCTKTEVPKKDETPKIVNTSSIKIDEITDYIWIESADKVNLKETLINNDLYDLVAEAWDIDSYDQRNQKASINIKSQDASDLQEELNKVSNEATTNRSEALAYIDGWVDGKFAFTWDTHLIENVNETDTSVSFVVTNRSFRYPGEITTENKIYTFELEKGSLLNLEETLKLVEVDRDALVSKVQEELDNNKEIYFNTFSFVNDKSEVPTDNPGIDYYTILPESSIGVTNDKIIVSVFVFGGIHDYNLLIEVPR